MYSLKLFLHTHYTHICTYTQLINEGPGVMDLSLISFHCIHNKIITFNLITDLWRINKCLYGNFRPIPIINNYYIEKPITNMLADKSVSKICIYVLRAWLKKVSSLKAHVNIRLNSLNSGTFINKYIFYSPITKFCYKMSHKSNKMLTSHWDIIICVNNQNACAMNELNGRAICMDNNEMILITKPYCWWK